MRLARLCAALLTPLIMGAFSHCRRETGPPLYTGHAYIPALYTSEAIKARVVDARTGKPVEGAVVVAVWRKVELFVERWDGIDRYEEAVTDGNGEFVISRWGPRPAPHDGFLDKRHPELWVIRRGYLVGYFDNGGAKIVTSDGSGFVTLPPNKMPNATRGAYARPADGGSQWNERDLAIERAGTEEALAASLSVADPLDPYYPRQLYPLRHYWSEWWSSRSDLSGELRDAVRHPPRSLIDYEVRTPRRR